MNTTPPFSFPPLPDLGLLQNLLTGIQPPAWLVDELQNRMVLLLNHVLLQEPQAMDRVRRQQGKSARLQWGRFDLVLVATKAGLLERPSSVAASEPFRADLTATLTQTGLPDVLKTLASGQKPPVNIEGDVQLAAEVAWLVDNLRWDLEEDLSRLIGDAAAHHLVSAARAAAKALRSFALRAQPGATGTAGMHQP